MSRNSMDYKPLNIVISGAGVAGAIVAGLLQNEPGVRVTTLERVDPDDHSDAGTGLNIGPNALKLLQQADPALCARLQAPDISLPWQSWRTSLTDGTELMNLPLAQVADNDGIRIRWADLYHQLRSHARKHIRFNTAVTGMNYVGNQTGKTSTPRLLDVTWESCIDGTSGSDDQVDMLIAGDGRYSKVRETFFGRPEPKPLGVVIYRVLVPDTAEGLIDDYEQWFNGPYRLLAFRVPGNALYIAGSFPIAPGAPIDEDARTADHLRELYTPQDSRPSDQARFLIDSICKHVDDIHWARVAEIEPAFADDQGRVLLLGDAAHAMVPTLGQGATSAIEDACVAALMIRDAVRSGPVDVPALLRAIAETRMARARFIMDLSRDASDTMLPGSDTVAGTRKKTRPEFLAKLEQLFRVNEAPAPLPREHRQRAG